MAASNASEIISVLSRNISDFDRKVETRSVGQVLEVGDHDTLMAREGAYFRLYQAQVRQGDESDELQRHKVWRTDEDTDG
jgi:hypothetical protein